MLTETWWRLYGAQSFEVVSVQQTASGMRRKPEPSVLAKIDVARCAAKRHFESKIISEGVLKKVRALDIIQGASKVGVAGVGAVGGALARSLVAKGKQVNLYDAKASYSHPRRGLSLSNIGMLSKGI